MKHLHHLKPKHRGGTDADGLVEVTITQHAMFHYCEWKLWGHPGDKVAWKCLSAKNIDSEQARRISAAEHSRHRIWTDESREKARQAKLGRTFKHKQKTKDKIGSALSVPIRCITLDTEYDSMSDASRKLGISLNSISSHLKGDRKKVRHNGKWITFEFLNT